MLQTSDNVIAEVLARQVALAEHRPASFAGAVAAIRTVLGRLGAQVGAGMHDGSGLAAGDRVAPAALVAVLRLIAGDGPPAPRSCTSSRPCCRSPGGAARCTTATPTATGRFAAGRVRAKTGTLTGGLVAGRDGARQVRRGCCCSPSTPTARSGTFGAEAALDALAPRAESVRLRLSRLHNVPVVSLAWAPSSTGTWPARAAKRFSPPPPTATRTEADEAVGELYQATSSAAGHVADLTGLDEPKVTAVTRVIDRSAWIDANTSGMRAVLTPLVDKLAADNPVGRVAETVGGRLTGVQVGLVLGFLSGKVLGQFEFFDRTGGQLLLVAPNIVAVERQLKVDPADFRLWVCLHEVTHRVQFTAVPWLRQHMHDEVEALTDATDTDPAALRQRLSGAVGELVKVVRGQGDGEGLMAVVATPEQRVVLDRLTAFMSLVEGHAEYVMNAVSPVGDPVAGGDREAVRRAAPQGRQCARPDAAPRARTRCQDAPVRRRRGVRPFGHRPRRARRLQRGVDVAADAAHQGRDRRSVPLGRARPRLSRRCTAMGPDHDHVAGRPASGRRRGAPRGAALADGAPLVACSGGADSLALAAAVAFEAPGRAALVTVDHGLQDGSADQARRVAALGYELGFDPVEIVTVHVGRDGGREAAARTARYAALDAVAAALDRDLLLGHTLDDQAETVLMGLGRGSGARSIAGMRPASGRHLRPLLGLRRATTEAACRALGLDVWDDPHNDDPRLQRVRLRREVLPLLEDVLQGGVAEALARTASQLQDDDDALDAAADAMILQLCAPGDGKLQDHDELDVAALAHAATRPCAPACCGPGPAQAAPPR